MIKPSNINYLAFSMDASGGSAPRSWNPPSLDFRFLRDSAWTSVLISFGVAFITAANLDRAWAGRYLFFASWSLAFFGMTAAILFCLVGSAKPGQKTDPRMKAWGLLAAAAKVGLLALIFAVMSIWPLPEGGKPGHASAIYMGVSTPLAALVLQTGWTAYRALRPRPGAGSGKSSSESTGEGPKGRDR